MGYYKNLEIETMEEVEKFLDEKYFLEILEKLEIEIYLID